MIKWCFKFFYKTIACTLTVLYIFFNKCWVRGLCAWLGAWSDFPSRADHMPVFHVLFLKVEGIIKYTLTHSLSTVFRIQ